MERKSGPILQKGGGATGSITVDSIPIRAPPSDDVEESYGTEEEEEAEEEEFESASERMTTVTPEPGSPVESYSTGVKVRERTYSHSHNSDSDSSSSSSSSLSLRLGNPRIRPVAKLSGEDDEEEQRAVVEGGLLVNQLEEGELEGFSVARVRPVGEEKGLEGVKMDVVEGFKENDRSGTVPGMEEDFTRALESDVGRDGVLKGSEIKMEVADGAADFVPKQEMVIEGGRKEGLEVEETKGLGRVGVSGVSGVEVKDDESDVIGVKVEDDESDLVGLKVGDDESDVVGTGKAVDSTADGTVDRELVVAQKEKAEAESDGEASPETVAGEFIAAEDGDKGDAVQESAVNAGVFKLQSALNAGVAELQSPDKEDASDYSESNLGKLNKENVMSGVAKEKEGECSSIDIIVKDDDTKDSKTNETFDAPDPNRKEAALATSIAIDEAAGNQTVKGLDFAEDTTRERGEFGLEVHSSQGFEESKDGVDLSEGGEQGSAESKEHIESEVPVANAKSGTGPTANCESGGERQDGTSKPEASPPDMPKTSDAKPQFEIEYSSDDCSIQKATDDGDEEIVDISALCTLTEAASSVVTGSSLDSSSKKDSTQESNANEVYDARNKVNEVASASSDTRQQIIDKEDIVKTENVVSDHPLLYTESKQGFTTIEKPDDTQETKAADMYQTKAVENQMIKGFEFAGGTTREEANFGLESQSCQNVGETNEGVELSQTKVLGSLESKEHIESKVPLVSADVGWKKDDDISKPEASLDYSDTSQLDSNLGTKSYFSSGEQDSDDNVLGDEDTAVSSANPQFMFESDDAIQKIVGPMVTDWDEEADDDDEDEDEDEEMVDPSALAALMEVASSAVSGSNNASFGAAGFPVSTRPAGLGSSVPSLDPMPRFLHHSRTNGPALSRPSPSVEDNQQNGESGETQEKVQMIRVKFLRLVKRLGQTPQNVVVTQVLYRLGLAEGLKIGTSAGRAFNSDRALTIAEGLEATGQEDLDFTCNILVLGKTGVGKSATINSIFDEVKSTTNAFQPATNKVRKILGSVHGIKVRVVDTPGLMPSFADHPRNKNIMLSIKKSIKKCPPDIVLYVDRLDVRSRDYSDLPLLKLVTETFGAAMWFNTIVVLSHASSAPPDGANGAPLSYEMFVAQRSHIVQHSIRQAAGDMRLMNPVSLVENHSACRRNREGQRVLPNGQVWKPQLLLLCFASKVLAEANTLLKLQDSTPGRPLGIRARAPPLPYLLSSLLQSRAQLQVPDEENGGQIDSDDDLEDLTDLAGPDEYDRLPRFKYLSKSELSKLTKEERKAYDDEVYNREKLYLKKQWKEELRKRKGMKNPKENQNPNIEENDNYDRDDMLPEPQPTPMPDMNLPYTFGAENPTYRYRYLDSSNQWFIRPVLDTHGWDHDVGYDGVNVERTIVIGEKIPASISGQITKDKKEATFQMECAASLKHGEHTSTLAGFEVQTVGKGLSYTVRSETRFSNFKCNKTAGGLSLTYLGNTLATGMKLEDSLRIGKRLKFVVNSGAMMGRGDVAYGGSLEATLRDKDYPIGEMLTTLGVSVMNWHGDLAIGGNLQSQFGLGRHMKIVARANLNNKRSGQISIRTSSSEYLQMALIGLIPIMRSLLHGRTSEPSYSMQ